MSKTNPRKYNGKTGFKARDVPTTRAKPPA